MRQIPRKHTPVMTDLMDTDNATLWALRQVTSRDLQGSSFADFISVHCRSHVSSVFCLFYKCIKEESQTSVTTADLPPSPAQPFSRGTGGKSAVVRDPWNSCTIILGFLSFLCDSLLHGYMTQYQYAHLLADWLHLWPNICQDFIAYSI